MPNPGPESTDRALHRFLRTGAPDDLADLFDATATALWRVALHLLGDASRAEDALQETFLAVLEARQDDALRRAPPTDALAWLTGVLHNRVRRQRRDVERRPDPVRVEAALRALQQNADPLADAERSELAGAIAGHIDQLPEIYRPVLRLSLQHGLAPQEIAASLERPPTTVRVQLARGLSLLRDRLGPGLASSLLAAAAALGVGSTRGLAAVRASVVEAASAALPAAAAAGGITTLWTTGTLVTMKKTLLGLTCLAALAVTGWMLSDPGPVPDGAPSKAAATTGTTRTTDLPPEAEMRAVEADSADATRTPAATVESDEAATETPTEERQYGDILVRVRWAGDGRPAEGARVSALNWGAGNAFLTRLQAATDARGEVLLDRMLVGTIDLRTGSDSVEVELEPESETLEVELTAKRHATVRGQVVGADGNPVAGATIVSSAYFNHSSCFEIGRADSEGRFEVPLGDAAYLGARAAGHVPTYYFLSSLEAGQSDDVILRLRGRAGRIRGRVVDSKGRGIHGARVSIGRSGYSVSEPGEAAMTAEHSDGNDATMPPHPMLRTDREGRFEFTEAGAGRVKVQARALDYGFAKEVIETTAGEWTEVQLELQDGVQIEGRVVGVDGQPVAKVSVTAGGARYADFDDCRTRTDADGYYRLDSVTPGSVSVRAARSEAGEATASFETAPGERIEWNPQLESQPALRGRVVDEAGMPIPGLQIAARNLDMMRPVHRNGRTDHDGRFEIAGLQLEPFSVRVVDPSCDSLACVEVHDVWPGEPVADIVLNAADRPSARIRGVLLGPDGNPPVAAKLVVWHGGEGHFHDFDLETGVFEIGPLPPRSVRITVSAGRLGDVPVDSFDLEPYQQVELGTIRLEEPGRVLAYVDMEIPEGAFTAVILASKDGRTLVSTQPDEDGKAELSTVPPGHHLAFLVGQHRSAIVPFEVRGGETVEVRLTAPTVAPRTLRLRRGPEPRALPDGQRSSARVQLYDADGHFAGEFSAMVTPGRETELTIYPPEDARGFDVVVLEHMWREVARQHFDPDDPLELEWN